MHFRHLNARVLLASLAAIGFACSYSPHPEDGKQACYTGGLCPDGYKCAYNNLCYTEGKVPPLPGSGGAGAGGVAGSGAGGALLGTGGVGFGGVPSTGGAVAKGGTMSLGGTASLGGTISFGGVFSLGGAFSLGGTMGMGGTTGAGGTTTLINTGTIMTVANNQAQGALTGFGWIAFAPKDIVTDPTCGSPLGPLASGVFCNLTNWSTTNAYCLSGLIPALPAMPTTLDYNDNWGIQIGVNATDPPGGVLGQSFTRITFSLSGTPSIGLRAIVHRRGDATGTTYCAVMTPGLPIALTSFNSTCWDGLGIGLTAADVPNIDQIGVQIPSTTTTIPITSLCLSSITFAR